MRSSTINNELVSIIVPVYNAAEFLPKSISSLRNQTHDNIEIVIIDDCSQDDSLAICRDMARDDDRIVVLYNDTNLGQEATRNRGLESAQGHWIMFLDSDDEYDIYAIENLLDFIDSQEGEVEVVLAPYNAINGDEISKREASIQPAVFSQRVFAEYLLTNIPWDVISCVGAKLYNASFLKRENIRFNRYYQWNEDGAFILTCLASADAVAYANIPFYQYLIRQHGSVQSTYRENMYEMLCRTDELLLDFLRTFSSYSLCQKKLYYRKTLDTAFASLYNEIKLGTLTGYLQTVKQIRKSSRIDEWLSYTTSSKERIRILAIKYHLDIPLYIAWKMLLMIRLRFTTK